MPIKLPANLPAFDVLTREGVMVMSESRAARQDIRPLRIGLLNLMPIPLLDGGHIVIMALEGIARRDFSMRVKEKMLLAGFVLLMTLMVTVIYNDLTRITWIERLMPWR